MLKSSVAYKNNNIVARMARPFRIQFDGAFYHVMNRGRNKKAVFHADGDYKAFIKGLTEVYTSSRTIRVCSHLLVFCNVRRSTFW